MSGITLYYFDIRGRAEIVRLVLTLAGQDFEDVRFSWDDWPKYKAEAPFGQSPYIEYKGKRYGQTAALATFCAKEFGLYGKSNLDRLRVDEVVGLTQDLYKAIFTAVMEQDQDKKAELLKKAVEEELPKLFGFYRNLLRDNSPNGVFVGKELTLADLYVHDVMLTAAKSAGYDAAHQYPELQTLRDKVNTHPRLLDYLASRKETPY